MSADAERDDRRGRHEGSRRRPGRFLAPVALIVVVVAVVVIIANAGSSSSSSAPRFVGTSTVAPTHRASGTSTRARTSTESGSSATTGSTATTATTATTTTSTVGTYTIVPGDTFSVISEKTGVPVTTIEKLNPTVSSSALTVGQVIKLK